MSFLRPIQWHLSHADLIWSEGTFKLHIMLYLFGDASFFDNGIRIKNMRLEVLPCKCISGSRNALW
jgi:hypothetical protein